MLQTVQIKTISLAKLTQRAIGTFWFFYFLLSIAIVGGVVAYGLSLPLFLLSKKFPGARAYADKILVNGVRVLMTIQPWYKMEILDTHMLRNSKIPRALFISNHRSNLDVFIILTLIHGPHIMAKKVLFFIPFLSLLMRLTEQIPIGSKSINQFWSAMNEAEQYILQNKNVLIFPEMTRCQEGYSGVLPFSSVPFKIARDTDATIIPLVFHQTDLTWPRGSISLRFRVPMKVEFLAPVPAHSFSTAEDLKNHVQTLIESRLI